MQDADEVLNNSEMRELMQDAPVQTATEPEQQLEPEKSSDKTDCGSDDTEPRTITNETLLEKLCRIQEILEKIQEDMRNVE